jgi:uncharacterized protein (TIGR03089 family)
MTTPVIALAQRVRANPGAPVVTYVAQARGERTELSAASVANAAAKIANALRDEYDLVPGDHVELHLPMHWQRSTWCAGIWTAGCVLASPGAGDIVVVAEDDPALAKAMGRELAVVSLHPFGMPITRELPARAHDVTITVRQQPDAYLFDTPGPDEAAMTVDGSILTGRQVWELAGERARAWQLQAGGRLLLDDRSGLLDLHDVGAWLGALAVPLAADASVVLATEVIDHGALERSEGITAWAAPPR